jgi:competence protein ComEA
VDINTADAAALDALPGVGPATAAAILAQRQAVGGFRSVEDLLEVRGIGEAKLAQLRPLVRV